MTQTMEWIKNNPEHWDQSRWHCGTSHCFAGVAEMLAQNIDPTTKYASESTKVIAEKALGLNDQQSDYLFDSHNDINKLSSTVDAWVNHVFDNANNTAIALTPDLPIELVTKLASDEDCDVRCKIANRLKQK